MTGETDPIKKNKLTECQLMKKQLDEEGGNKGRHEVPSPLMMSGTKVNTHLLTPGFNWFRKNDHHRRR